MYFQGYNHTTAVIQSGQLGGQGIVDTGTVTLNVPQDVAQAYNLLFDPPGIYIEDDAIWITNCTAKGPSAPFSVVFNGTTFHIPGKDFVLGELTLAANGLPGPYGEYCLSGVQSGGVFGER